MKADEEMCDTEVNYLVAEKVMGLTNVRKGNLYIEHSSGTFEEIPDYCNSWEAMKEVMIRLGTCWQLQYSAQVWVATYLPPNTLSIFISRDATAPRAVALTALKFLEEKK